MYTFCRWSHVHVMLCTRCAGGAVYRWYCVHVVHMVLVYMWYCVHHTCCVVYMWYYVCALCSCGIMKCILIVLYSKYYMYRVVLYVRCRYM